MFRDNYEVIEYAGLKILFDSQLWSGHVDEHHGAFLRHRNSRNGDLLLHIRCIDHVMGPPLPELPLVVRLNGHLCSQEFRVHQRYPNRVDHVVERTFGDRAIIRGDFPRGLEDKTVRTWFASDGHVTAYVTTWHTAETAAVDLEACDELIESIEFPSSSSRS